jgi:hypothetical protein
MSWIMSPDRPSPKGNLLILHFAVDVKRLAECGKEYPWPRPHRCPCCQGRRLWGHGYVFRYFDGISEGLWMKRFRCPDCRAVHTSRLKGFYRGFSYSIFSILLSLLEKIIHNRWLRCLSRQAQQYWWRGLRFQASRRKNCRVPDISSLGWLLRQGIMPATHCIQCDILRL